MAQSTTFEATYDGLKQLLVWYRARRVGRVFCTQGPWKLQCTKMHNTLNQNARDGIQPTGLEIRNTLQYRRCTSTSMLYDV